MTRCPTCGRSLSERSTKQNSYLWGVVYQTIADEVGSSPEDVHQQMKEQFLPRMFVTIGDQEREIDKTTTILSTSEMETYLLKIRQWAQEFLNCLIPLPNEV